MRVFCSNTYFSRIKDTTSTSALSSHYEGDDSSTTRSARWPSLRSQKYKQQSNLKNIKQEMRRKHRRRMAPPKRIPEKERRKRPAGKGKKKAVGEKKVMKTKRRVVKTVKK